MAVKVDFTEARRLRPLSAKRIREEFVEYESDIETDEASFNMSLDSSVLETSFSTRSTSGHVGRIEEENRLLKVENAKIDQRLGCDSITANFRRQSGSMDKSPYRECFCIS